ncbi:Na/Pi symporter [Alkalihalobacillus trypoxylicola]|uniref:Na/Pi cotransporter n=1 Tax=Alkalihalobacillus trypoxylicola TaxID=519424 RepID=A0A161PFU3_9BACI|nr:Na/Pi symporter [Alkalihalobacillus trypoxylicola]KYG32027.1 Na/Pi cotransporter [Alkalihalobacillus trypoxylicola]
MIKEVFSLLAVFIGLFLFGMVILRNGFAQIGQEKIRVVILKMTNSTWKGLLIGIIITALIQSSSAVMVITIALVASKLLTFKHSIGIILGTNIGTTVTTELIAYEFSSFIVPFLLFGFLFFLLPGKLPYALGCLTFGLACIFIAMEGLKELAHPLASISFVHNFFNITNEHHFIGILVGTVLTAIIHSSTATVAIAMGFINDHILTLPAAISIMLGANIGTCMTAYIASLGAGQSAKRVAYANIWLNVFGVVLFIPFIQLFSEFVMTLTTNPMMQVAHSSLIFNIVCSVLILPFVSLFTRFLLYIHPLTEAEE